MEVGTPLDLPSQRALRDALGVSALPRRKARLRWAPAGFRLERGSARTWGTNALLDDLESKDGLAQRIVDTHAEALAPESVVIPWDSEELRGDAAQLLADAVAAAATATRRAAVAVAVSADGGVGTVGGAAAADAIVVLKPAMGSGGKGIEFHDARDPETAGRIVAVVRENATAALKEGPAFMDSVRARNNGRVPGACTLCVNACVRFRVCLLHEPLLRLGAEWPLTRLSRAFFTPAIRSLIRYISARRRPRRP